MGSKNKSSPAPAPSQEEIAMANAKAQAAAIPLAQKTGYESLANPQYGLLPTTQLYENVRQQVFPGEQNIRGALESNILSNLLSPTGLSSEQQSAQEAIRNKQAADLQRAIQTSANLGGGLFGGRRELREDKALTDLYNQYSVEDINRQETARQQAIQNAIPILQILFPDIALTQPNYMNPVASADTATQAAMTARGQDLNYATQQQANNSALYSALFSGLGTAAGGALAGPLGASLGGMFGGAAQGFTKTPAGVGIGAGGYY